MRGGARGMRGGNITSVSVEEDLPNSDLADQHRVAFSPPYSALATLPLHSPGPQSPPALQSISGQDQQSSQGQAVPHAPHGQREEQTVQHSVQTVAANSGEPMASAGRIIQGTTSTYQEAIILHARDYLLENGISVKELVYSDLVRYIRGSYPMAWKDRDASQAGKSLKHMLHKALNLRKEQKSFIMGTGISGLRKNALQCALDEILTLNITAAMPPVNGEYLAEGTRRLSAAEKKRKGEALRRKGVTMPGPSRSREERPWSSFHGVLEKAGSSMESGMNEFMMSSSRARAEMEERKAEREEARLRKEEKERAAEERRNRQENQQSLFQLAMIKACTGKNDDVEIPGNTLKPSLKSITVLQDNLEDDSETLPALLTVTDLRTLMDDLIELMGLSKENKNLVMVLNKTRILNTDLISNGASFNLSYKVKENKIKFYLDSNNV